MKFAEAAILRVAGELESSDDEYDHYQSRFHSHMRLHLAKLPAKLLANLPAVLQAEFLTTIKILLAKFTVLTVFETER